VGVLIAFACVCRFVTHVHVAVASALLVMHILLFCAAMFIGVSFQTEAMLAMACGLILFSLHNVDMCSDGGVYSMLGGVGEQCVTWNKWLGNLAITTTTILPIALYVDTSTFEVEDKNIEGHLFVAKLVCWGAFYGVCVFTAIN